jgi:hypothetical protein
MRHRVQDGPPAELRQNDECRHYLFRRCRHQSKPKVLGAVLRQLTSGAERGE